MKSTRSTRFKIGLLALAAITALLLAIFGLGVRALRSPTVSYHTYFDESVQGLELGAPVKFRGVRIGNVEAISIAPDRRQIDVELAILVDQARKLGLAQHPPELRTQLAMQGITGVKFVDVNVFDPRLSPPPKLSFQPPPNYIPARPSLLAGIGGDVEVATRQLPEVIAKTSSVMSKIEGVLDDIRAQGVVTKIVAAANQATGAAAGLRGFTRNLESAKLGPRAAKTIDNVNKAVTNLNGVVARFGEIGRSATGATGTLEQTMNDIGDAARSIRELAEALEREPDMLVHGRERTRER